MMQMLSQLSQRYGYQSPNFQKPDEIASTYDDVKSMLADQKAAREAQAKQIIGQGLLGQAQANADTIKAKIAQLQAMQAAEQNPATKETLQAQIEAAMAQLQKIQMQGAEGFADPMQAIDRALTPESSALARIKTEEGANRKISEIAQEMSNQSLQAGKILRERIDNKDSSSDDFKKAVEEFDNLTETNNRLYTEAVGYGAKDYQLKRFVVPNLMEAINQNQADAVRDVRFKYQQKRDVKKDEQWTADFGQKKESNDIQRDIARANLISAGAQAAQAKAALTTIDQKKLDNTIDLYVKQLKNSSLSTPGAYDTLLGQLKIAYDNKNIFAAVKSLSNAIEPGLSVTEGEVNGYLVGGDSYLAKTWKSAVGASDADQKKIYDIAVKILSERKNRALDLTNTFISNPRTNPDGFTSEDLSGYVSEAAKKTAEKMQQRATPSGNVLKDMSNKGGGANTGTPKLNPSKQKFQTKGVF